jgi:hypothetical protein
MRAAMTATAPAPAVVFGRVAAGGDRGRVQAEIVDTWRRVGLVLNTGDRRGVDDGVGDGGVHR